MPPLVITSTVIVALSLPKGKDLWPLCWSPNPQVFLLSSSPMQCDSECLSSYAVGESVFDSLPTCDIITSDDLLMQHVPKALEGALRWGRNRSG